MLLQCQLESPHILRSEKRDSELTQNMAGKIPSILTGSQMLQRLKPNGLLSVTCTRKYADWQPKDEVTHTGQIFDPKDYRLSRFVERPKYVNPNWAVKLIDDAPPEPRKDRIVSCDGGGGPLGHPKVYINLDKPGNHCCGYCGLRFYKEDHHH